MKIAFLTTEYPHPRISGAAGIATSIKNLAEALVREGVSVTVIVANQHELEQFEENGISFHLLPKIRYRFFSWFRYRKYIQKYINDLHDKRFFDVLEAPDWTGITAYMKLKMPVVIRLHGSDSYFCRLENRPQHRKHFFLEKKAVTAADAIISPSAFTADLSAEIFKIDRSRITVIHYGISMDKFRNDHHQDFEKGLILCSGTVVRKKGALELPHIFKLVSERYPSARLMLIGGDASDALTGAKSTWKLLQDMLPAELKEKVVYTGRISYDEMKDQIARAHVCIFPTFAETLGMVTIEAMAMGKAVVNSDIGWAKEIIVEGQSGLMAHPSDHQAYADKILSILNDDLLRIKLETGAVARVRDRFDISRNVKINLELYRKLAGE